MKIIEVELVGYRRLLLANIKRFLYTPQSHVQLILGTNGSGKSSILHELSPLPATHSDYIKGGFKRVVIDHNGSRYELLSSFKSDKHHEFLKDGEELNPGHTGTVQKDLCLQHFRYTQELHELFTGVLRFSLMPVSKRRDQITALSTNDYSYAMGIFQKAKARARDAQGADRHLKQRLVQETQALRALEQMVDQETRLETLRNELTALLSSRDPSVPRDSYQQRMRELLRLTETTTEQILKTIRQVPREHGYIDLDSFEQSVRDMEYDVQGQQSLLDRVGKEYTEMENIRASMSEFSDIPPEQLDSHLVEVGNEIAVLRQSLRKFTQIDDAVAVARESAQVLDNVVGLFTDLPDNHDRRYSSQRLNEAREKITAIKHEHDRMGHRMRRIVERMAHMDSARELSCPKCSYVWREGFSDQEYATLKAEREALNASMESILLGLGEPERAVEENEQYGQLMLRFRSFTQSYHRLQPLWDLIVEENLHINRPSESIGLFDTWQHDLQIHCRIATLAEKEKHLTDLVARQRNNGGIAQFAGRMGTLVQEIELITGTLKQGRATLREKQQHLKQMQWIEASLQQLSSQQEELNHLTDLSIRQMRNRTIDQVTAHHHSEMSEIQRQLTERATLQGIVRDLERSQLLVSQDFAVWTLIAKALSPADGIIAEQLRGFIECLVGQMNAVIGSVWTYEMLVEPCGLGSGELDYKFPLHIKPSDSRIVDISRGSKSQMAIVDTAYQLTAMLYMGLNHYPLFLDEPGEGFDEQHRVNMMTFIKQLMDMNQHSQLFMISHHVSNHGSFLNSEALVLDTRNIAVPGVYNQHVVIE